MNAPAKHDDTVAHSVNGAADAVHLVPAAIGTDLQRSLAHYLDFVVREWRTRLEQVDRQLQGPVPPEQRAELEALRQITRFAVETLAQIGELPREGGDDQGLEAVRWHELAGAYQREQAAGDRLWAKIRQAAREELASGRTAGTAVETYFHEPIDRARFLAIRTALADGLRPANGAEWLLVDGMTQAWTMYLRWVDKHAKTESLDAERVERAMEHRGEWAPPRLRDAAAVDRAAQMADRFQRQFLRLMKAYRDQRRVLGQVIVAAGGQLNVGQQQVNVAAVRETNEP